MTKRHGYALLAALAAIVVLISAAIYLGVTGTGARDEPADQGARTPRSSAAPASSGSWVAAWSASPVGGEPGTELRGYAGQSIRNVVHTHTGGSSARVTLSNLYGQQPLNLTRASIALTAAPNNPSAAPGTLRALTFDGRSDVVIPPGEQRVSDAVRIRVPDGSDLLITTFSPTPSGPVTYHPHARQISYVARGERTDDESGAAYTQQSPFWRYVTAVDVYSNESQGAVVVLGDSLTDGITSTMGANRRWTDVLAQRMRDEPGNLDLSVVNQGISGNRLLSDGLGRPAGNPSGLNRFERDALSRSGVRGVVVALGINDILRNPHDNSAAEIADGLRDLTRQAHQRGLRVTGATLMPFGGHRGWTPEKEQMRQEVNTAIRAGKVFDHYVDFDKAVRDPYDAQKLRPAYDSGDHLHPSDAGFRKMGESFDLSLLRKTAPAQL